MRSDTSPNADKCDTGCCCYDCLAGGFSYVNDHGCAVVQEDLAQEMDCYQDCEVGDICPDQGFDSCYGYDVEHDEAAYDDLSNSFDEYIDDYEGRREREKDNQDSVIIGLPSFLAVRCQPESQPN